jgi:hypothetical protein
MAAKSVALFGGQASPFLADLKGHLLSLSNSGVKLLLQNCLESLAEEYSAVVVHAEAYQVLLPHGGCLICCGSWRVPRCVPLCAYEPVTLIEQV